MKAVKENKVYRILTEDEKKRYLEDGFDIYSDEGTVLEYSPKKKITYGEHIEVLKAAKETLDKVEAANIELAAKNKALEAELKKSKKGPPSPEKENQEDPDKADPEKAGE